MNWEVNSPKNLLPLSESRIFAEALKEWAYNGDNYDLLHADEVCQLCEYMGLRFQFTIINRHNGKELLVGSECIKRFPSIAVLDAEGNVLSSSKARQKVDSDRRRLVTDAKLRSVLGSLALLAISEPNIGIESFEEDLKKRGAFTPKQLSLLFWRLEKNSVPHTKAYFKLSIRRPLYQQDLLSMEDFKIKRLLPAMSASQKRWLNKERPNLLKR